MLLWQPGFVLQAVNIPQPHHPLHHEDAQDGASHQVAIGGEEQSEYVSGLKDRGAKFSTTYPPGSKLQPAGIFSYLPEDYTKPKLPISGNSLADDTAATVKKFFTIEVLERRRTVDDHLKAFKLSLGKDINDPLPACFVAWKNEIFPEWEEVPKEGSFHFDTCISNDQASLLQSIHANKARDSLTPELINTGTHMNNLLAACLRFLQQKDDLKRKLKEQNVQLYMLYIEVRTRTTDMIIKELQSLPTEIDQFADEIHILIKNIQVALDSYGMKKRKRNGVYIHASRKIQRIIPEADNSQMQESNVGML